MRWWLFVVFRVAASVVCTGMDENANGEQWECPAPATCGYEPRECCRVYAEPGNDGIDTETRCFINQ